MKKSELKHFIKKEILKEIRVKQPSKENFNKFEVNMDPSTNIPTDKDLSDNGYLQRINLKVVEEVPFLVHVKKYIYNEIEKIKQDPNEFDHLIDAGFFENEFEENIILHFEQSMPNVLDVSKKVKAYISSLL
jgi:hypothetical protein